MELRKLEKIVVAALEDIKGRDIDVINTSKISNLFDRVVVASGDSNRQVRALAHNVEIKVREAGGHVISVEGEENGEWVLVDLGDIIVHVMQPSVRSYYALEELWTSTAASRKRIESKGGPGAKLVKASEGAADE